MSLDFEPRAARTGGPATLVLTRIRSVAPGSDARRALVRSFEKEGQRWAYLTPNGQLNRTSADRQRYPVGASLQWWTGTGGKRAPSVTFLFQAARGPGATPGSEETVLDVLLEDPRQPRRF